MFAKSMTLAKADLERAFAENEFDILLQPQIDVEEGAVIAAEAFVRWNNPTFGIMTPQMFLPFVDQQGESPRLLDAVIKRSLQAAEAFAEAGRPWRVSINLGASDLRTGVAPDIIAAALRGSDVRSDMLILEAPESALSDGDETVHVALRRLREMGCGIALDSGGSLPMDTSETEPDLFTEIKIGGPAIMRFAEIARKVDGGRIQRRLGFAQMHGLNSIAVGVEQEKTLSALVRLGFTGVQGAFVAKPTTLEALLSWDGTWAGGPEIEAAEVRPVVRPRPRLVVPPPPPVAEPAPKLVEQLTEEPFDDALDVGFDDEFFDEAPDEAAPAIEDFDPTADMDLDEEELMAMDQAPSLHAGMIDRPRKRMASYRAEPEPMPLPQAEPEVPEEKIFERPLALRVKAAPVRRTIWQRLGLAR